MCLEGFSAKSFSVKGLRGCRATVGFRVFGVQRLGFGSE